MKLTHKKSKKKLIFDKGLPSTRRKWASLIKYFIFSTWIFLPPKPKKILIIDGVQNPFKKYFKEKDINILYRRGEEMNIFVLFSCLVNFKLSTESYYKRYIQFAEPKIILSAINTFPMFYRLSKLTNVKTACIQWGKQTLWDGVFAYKHFANRRKKKKLFIDYIFTYNKKVSEKFNSFCGGQTVEIGSFYNNMEETFTRRRKKEILFLSTHKPYIDGETGHLKYDYNFFFKNDKYVIKYLSDFASENNLKLNVLGRCRENLSILERKFFDEIIGKKYEFLPNYEGRKTNKITEKYEYVFTIDSTLAIENLIKNGKSGFLFNRPNVFPINTRRNGGFEKIPYKGPFWTTTSANNKKEFNRVLNFVIKTDNKTWKQMREKYGPRMMVYDKGNKKFLKIVNRHIS